MMTSMILSLLFLVSYICHHLFSESTSFGGEGPIRYVYYFILITHIILAAVILPLFFTLPTGHWWLNGLHTVSWPRSPGRSGSMFRLQE